MVKNQTNPEAIVNFNRPLSCSEMIKLLGDSVVEGNKNLEDKWKKLPLLKKFVTLPDVYYLDYEMCHYCSHDGETPMKPCKYLLNSEEFPDAKYEYRYLISICGLRDYRLYFNVIPGIAEENQFGTMIREHEKVSCITIKANMKSEPKWEYVQSEFLKMLVPIIERINKEKKWGYQFDSLFFYVIYINYICPKLIILPSLVRNAANHLFKK